MTTTTTTFKHAIAGSGSSLLSNLLNKITHHLVHRRAHAALANLDDPMLRDIGLSRAEVEKIFHRS